MQFIKQPCNLLHDQHRERDFEACSAYLAAADVHLIEEGYANQARPAEIGGLILSAVMWLRSSRKTPVCSDLICD